MVDDLLQAGADVHAKTADGQAAIHLARSAEVVRSLIRHRADIKYARSPFPRPLSAPGRLWLTRSRRAPPRSVVAHP